MINKRIGSFIAVLRKEQGLTQEQLAEKLGVSNRSVSRWENGNTLPDLSLMQSICEITGVTLAELLSGARQDPSDQGKDGILTVLALWEREKLAKIKMLNFWFALGGMGLLTAVGLSGILTQAQTWLLAGCGIFFQGLGFCFNNRDPRLSDGEKAVLTAANDAVSMHSPEELLAFARKRQRVAKRQYEQAFREICENLTEQEKVTFAMVAEEYSVDGTPGCWHVGIAVTRDRVFLCGETVAGRVMTRTVMDVCDRKDILSVQHQNRSIRIRTPKGLLALRGAELEALAEAFRCAVLPEA